ncbi:hypothetical protein J2S43_004406 [Catenuloplanes nepalensis]|uniref:Uncharacterized protein n=1 Tax=Catenuloplanes nepalensis TaxID=587533 RepID=A0ABT9MWS8_9ACTN|nr:hypothetical protein [Catenuloplanes nepalensis]MDP9795894.1 hypothetical protein [Catenuloplanes nepalensis]
MLRRLTPWLIVLAVVIGSMVALSVRPVAATVDTEADYVVVVGVPGLRWDDLDPQVTPSLWALAERGAIGALSVRSASEPTCPADGWLTLGAGNYAGWGDESDGAETCAPLAVDVEEPDGIGANVPRQPVAVDYNGRQPWGAVPGALAESVRCTTAVGPGAAIAAARPFGRVDRYAGTLPTDAATVLSQCVLSIVDAGTVAGDGAARAAAVEAADDVLGRVLAARPARSLVLVAGLSDTGADQRLHVAIADGPGWDRSWLTSASTARDGYLALVDLAPTALTALGRELPAGRFDGHAATAADGRPAELADAMARPADADREARAQGRTAEWFFSILTAAQIALYALLVPLLRRTYAHSGPPGPPLPPRWLMDGAELALIAAALVTPAALVADLVPWWRSGRPSLVFAAVTIALTLAGTLAVRLARPYRATLWPLGAVAATAAVVVISDVLSGSTLQLNGVAGYSTLAGGRYAGIGTVGLGVLTAGILLAAAALGQMMRNLRPLIMVLLGGTAVMVVGSPFLGAHAVGAVALTAGVCVATALCTGGWIGFGRIAATTAAGLMVTIGFALLDVRRPEAERGSLGRILASLVDGSSGIAVQRATGSNVVALVSPLTLLVLTVAALVWFVLLRPWGGLKRLFGLKPAVRAALAGTAVTTLAAGVLGGSALHIAGAAAAVAGPLAALTALRVLDHAADRTRPPVAPMTEPSTPSEGTAGDSATGTESGASTSGGTGGGDSGGDPPGDPAGSPGDGADPVVVDRAGTVETSAGTAETSAGTAETSAGTAETSAGTAETSAGTAETSAGTVETRRDGVVTVGDDASVSNKDDGS